MPFNENQPRVPAGHENGGQWTAGDATAAIQNAASDDSKKEKKDIVGTDEWFNDFIKKVTNGEYNDWGSMPTSILKSALREWVGEAANIRSLDDTRLAKQLFLRGVEQQTEFKELYRGESYYVPGIDKNNSTFDYLAENVYKKGNVLDVSKPITVKNEDGSGDMMFDNRLVSYTFNPTVAKNFAKTDPADGGYHSIFIRLKNDNGIKGFDISSVGLEAEVVVGDHKKYIIEDVKSETRPIYFFKKVDENGNIVDGPAFNKKSLYVTIRQQ